MRWTTGTLDSMNSDKISSMAARWFTTEWQNGKNYGWMDMINKFNVETDNEWVECGICKRFAFDHIEMGFFFSCKIFDFNSQYKVQHFTQYVWADASEVGCAASVREANMGEGNNTRTIWLCCNYNIGNILTRPVYKVGAPASQCANGQTGNNPQYPGLCSTQTPPSIQTPTSTQTPPSTQTTQISITENNTTDPPPNDSTNETPFPSWGGGWGFPSFRPWRRRRGGFWF